KAIRRRAVDAVSTKPQILAGLRHPCNLRGAIDPDDAALLNAKDCVSGPKGKELTKPVFPKPKSSCPGGAAVGRQNGDEAVPLQAIDSLGSRHPEDAATILIGRQQAIAREPVGGGESSNLAIRYAVEAVRIGNPQGTITGGHNGRNRAVG